MMRFFLANPPVSISRPVGFRVAECEAEVDSRLRRRLDLGDDVIAVERHDRLARADLHVLANRSAELDQLVVQRPEVLFSHVHGVDVARSEFQVRLRIDGVHAFAERHLGDPPGGVGAEAVLVLEPGAALFLRFRPDCLA